MKRKSNLVLFRCSLFLATALCLMISSSYHHQATAFANDEEAESDGGGPEWGVRKFQCYLAEPDGPEALINDELGMDGSSSFDIANIKKILEIDHNWKKQPNNIFRSSYAPQYPNLFHVMMGVLPGFKNEDPDDQLRALITGEDTHVLVKPSNDFMDAYFETQEELRRESTFQGVNTLKASLNGDFKKKVSLSRLTHFGLSANIFTGPMWRFTDAHDLAIKENITVDPDEWKANQQEIIDRLSSLPGEDLFARVDEGHGILFDSDTTSILVHFLKNVRGGNSQFNSRPNRFRLYVCPHNGDPSLSRFNQRALKKILQALSTSILTYPEIISRPPANNSQTDWFEENKNLSQSFNSVNKISNLPNLSNVLLEIATLSLSGQLKIISVRDSSPNLINLIQSGASQIQQRVSRELRANGWNTVPVLAGSAILYAAINRFPALRYIMSRPHSFNPFSSTPQSTDTAISVVEIVSNSEASISLNQAIEIAVQFSMVEEDQRLDFLI